MRFSKVAILSAREEVRGGVGAAAGVNRADTGWRTSQSQPARQAGMMANDDRAAGGRGRGGSRGRESVGCESQNRRMELLLLNRL